MVWDGISMESRTFVPMTDNAPHIPLIIRDYWTNANMLHKECHPTDHNPIEHVWDMVGR